MRADADAELEAVLVLTTLGAPPRRLLGGRRGRGVDRADPEPVPTGRATVVRPSPFSSREEADAWLSAASEDATGDAVAVLNRALHAYRVSAATVHPSDLSADDALVVRVGYGGGEAVSDGRYAAARELRRRGGRTRRSMQAPEERFAAILAGHERALPAEELVLRARADLEAGRDREAALQARVALESLLAERAGLDADRETVAAAANAALRGPLDVPTRDALAAAVARMEAELRRRRLGG